MESISDPSAEAIDGYTMAFISAQVRVTGVSINPTVVVAHIPGPWPYPIDDWRRDLDRMPTTLREIAERADRGSVIVAADVNSTTDMRPFRTLLHDGYRDAAEQSGAGSPPSRPTRSYSLVAIDHILTRDCAATSLHTLGIPDSDHRGLVVTVTVPPSSGIYDAVSAVTVLCCSRFTHPRSRHRQRWHRAESRGARRDHDRSSVPVFVQAQYPTVTSHSLQLGRGQVAPCFAGTVTCGAWEQVLSDWRRRQVPQYWWRGNAGGRRLDQSQSSRGRVRLSTLSQGTKSRRSRTPRAVTGLGDKGFARGSRHSCCRAKCARRQVADAKAACQQMSDANQRLNASLQTPIAALTSYFPEIGAHVQLCLTAVPVLGRPRLNRLRPNCTRRRGLTTTDCSLCLDRRRADTW